MKKNNKKIFFFIFISWLAIFFKKANFTAKSQILKKSKVRTKSHFFVFFDTFLAFMKISSAKVKIQNFHFLDIFWTSKNFLKLFFLIFLNDGKCSIWTKFKQKNSLKFFNFNFWGFFFTLKNVKNVKNWSYPLKNKNNLGRIFYYFLFK